MIDVTPLELPDVLLVNPTVHRDERGFFVERYQREAYRAAGIDADFRQDNHSRSRRNTLRGLHFQRPPFAQAKLVSVVRGRIFDVAVDLRRGSPTYGRWVGAELDDEGAQQLYVPAGFAHGFVVRSDVADVSYKVSGSYAPDHEGGLRWDDPDLAIPWGVEQPSLSRKDAEAPLLADLVPIDLRADDVAADDLPAQDLPADDLRTEDRAAAGPEANGAQDGDSHV